VQQGNYLVNKESIDGVQEYVALAEEAARPTDWWRCFRIGPVSGRYEGPMISPTPSRMFLDLRVDIDPRHPNSPVMNRISGDFSQVFASSASTQIQVSNPKLSELREGTVSADNDASQRWKVYTESWIIDIPRISWSRCSVEINGLVRFWKSAHPSTNARVVIPWRSFTPAGPAEVTFTENEDHVTKYSCMKLSNYFRELTLEVDVTKSVNREPILPSYDTHSHSVRPVDLPKRDLTIGESYQEAGVCLSIAADRTVIDDSAAEFTSWSPAELHDAMETYYSQFSGTWPKWRMWGLLCGTFDDPLVGGLMFDARAGFGGSGDPPDRQGFAVSRNHQWLNNLVAGTPANQDQVWAARQFLYLWVHEAGHAFNLMHSWVKDRPDSLSWMNYPQRVENFWSNFRFRFDDEELIHIRHGDRASVIMGGDRWASGGHLEDSPSVMFQLEGQPPLEFLLRSKDYFDYLEVVDVELRLRNITTTPIMVDTRLDPSFGLVTIQVKRPDGRIVKYKPVLHQESIPLLKTLEPTNGNSSGEDRYSESILLNYGKDGWLFEQSGDYLLRAIYNDRNLAIPSNTLRVRIGAPESKEEDKIGKDFYSNYVGMILTLNGSESPYLHKGKAVLETITKKYSDRVLGAKLAVILAASEARPFFRIKNLKKPVLEQVHSPNPTKALSITSPALEVYRKDKEKQLNILYHELTRNRVNALLKTKAKTQARQELSQLRKDLTNRGVKNKVLKSIKEYEDSIR
jgi:hypothetical protein